MNNSNKKSDSSRKTGLQSKGNSIRYMIYKKYQITP